MHDRLYKFQLKIVNENDRMQDFIEIYFNLNAEAMSDSNKSCYQYWRNRKPKNKVLINNLSRKIFIIKMKTQLKSVAFWKSN